MTKNSFPLVKKLGFLGGILLCTLLLFLPAPANLTAEGWRVAAVAILMAIFWIFEAIPIPATALLPVILFPVLGINSVKEATAPYANPLIFLFMGGFIIALAMQKSNLHKRFALQVINLIGVNPQTVVLGFMIATAFLSMWVSNTATAMMMLPIGMSVIELAKAQQIIQNEIKPFELSLLLGIAFSASIGGLGTLIGTPPNALLAGFMSESYGFQIGFAQWMMVGVPVVIIGLPIAYFVLVKIAFPVKIKNLEGEHDFIESEISKLGKTSKAEKIVMFVFALVALMWITRPLIAKFIPGLSDASIAILGAILLFFIPVNFGKGEFVIDWKYAEKLPWGVLLLFGGGLSLASAINQSGLAVWIGENLKTVDNLPIVLIVMLIVFIIIMLTELTSNTATAAAFLPIMASVAISIGQNPLLFTIPAAIAATCAFMLPVATPPNAIIYSSGSLTIPQMAKAGIILNIIFTLFITLLAFTIMPLVFKIHLNVLPNWVH